ncbi:MAG: EamA family transporter, partial [Oscillospiraceae bacterium]|nr:EamA family transporter [Oscillospiraceae bacterium]
SVYICFALANKLTTAANAIVLQFTAPVFIVLFSAVLYKKEIRRPDLAVVLVVLAGIALFFFDQLGPSTVLGNFVAIAAGMFMAGMYMAVDRLEPQERFSAIVIGQAFAFLIGLPAVIITKPVMNVTTVSCILILGVFQLGLSYILYVRASETCPPLACCLLGAVEPLLNPVWVMIFDGEKPGVFALVGGIIVITAVTAWTVWDGKQKAIAAAAGRESL